MAIFQKSVINKHLTNLDKEQVEKAYLKFKENYSLAKIEKIKQLKEEEYQDGFLRDLFVDVFGYTLKPDDNYNLAREFKNQADGKKADGAIIDNNGVNPVALAVIELKSTKTKDFKNVTEQAFGYKSNQPECKYVIISNFQKLRFYVDYANEYEEFDLFHLNKEDFELLYLILKKESIFSNLPLKLKEETKFHEQEVSGKLYKDYSHFKRKLFENLTKNHPESDKLTLFKKSQKLIDRFLFVLFAEDSGLLPPNSISRIIDTYHKLTELDAYKPIYDIYKQYFGYMNIGRKGKTNADNIPAYNGGLFFTDDLLDNLKIDDEILIDDLLRLSEYDFNTEVDVNILGHIFEHSLSEIEEITSEIEGTASDITKSKRKKDGVFYTPKYITQYIVENTIGTLCNEKRKELEIEEIEFDGTYKTKDGKLSAKGKKLFTKLENYKDWLKTLKIVDPACGSGAFLNQALNFLIEEHKNIDDIISELTNTPLRLFDVDKAILENNLYGVDINEESVEIAKLSLWLRTAQKGRKLSVLSNNIKCGNSLIDDPEVAGEKAFDWNKEFPQVFKKKEKKAWHITTATHNSRYSQRMFDNHVKPGEAIWISEKDEIIVTETIADIINEDNLNVVAYNICGDHMHMLLVCEKEEMPKIVGKLKAVSGRKYNIEKGITRGHVPLSSSVSSSISSDTLSWEDTDRKGESEKKKYNSLWTQKFGKRKITDDNDLRNVINYIRNNRQKHELPENKKLEKIISEMTCSVEHAFRAEYKGGFDVVIGNPPYVKVQNLNHKEIDWFKKHKEIAHKRIDISLLFFELANEILKPKGILSFITSNQFIVAEYGQNARKFILEKFCIKSIIDFGDLPIFYDALTYVSIFTFKNDKPENFEYIKIDDIEKAKSLEFNNSIHINISTLTDSTWILTSSQEKEVIRKINLHPPLNSIAKCSYGIVTGNDSLFILKQEDIEKYRIEREVVLPLLRAENCNRYGYSDFTKFVIYPFKHEQNKTVLMDIEEIKQNYHNLYNYLLNNKEILLKRKDSRKTFENSSNWYSLTRFGQLDVFKSEKIVFPGETKQNKFGIDYNKAGYSGARVFAITINNTYFSINYLLTLLNSKLLEYYLHSQTPLKQGGYYSYSSTIIDNLPVPHINNQHPFVEKANKMLELNQQLQEKKNKYLNRVKDNLATTIATKGHDPLTIKISKKLDNFYDYDFKTFIAELKKQKIKLSLVQQDEWEEYFNAYKTEINNLQSEINKTDAEIDRMVYELYGLTEEEVGIVETSTNK